MKLWRSLIPILVVAASDMVFATAKPGDALTVSINAARQTKVAIASVPPFLGIAPTGEPVGYAVEVVNLALKGMKLPTITPVTTEWSAMIPGLQAHQYDFVAPGVAITRERCDTIVFSAPVWSQQFGIIVPTGNPDQIVGVKTFAGKPESKLLAVVSGSAEDFYAVENGIKEDQLVRVTDVQTGVAAVKGGRASGFLVGQFSVHEPEKKGVAVVVDRESPVFGYSAAFRKENVVFRDAFNAQIDTMRKDGSLEQLYSFKFGIPNWHEFIKKTRASDFYSNCR